MNNCRYDFSLLKEDYPNRLPKSTDPIRVICLTHGTKFSILLGSFKRKRTFNWYCQGKKPTGYWNIKENCIQEALKYHTKSDWWKNSGVSYNRAKFMGWFEECTVHMINEYSVERGYWQIKENCIGDALKYDSIKEWRINSNVAYGTAATNGWLDDCCKHMKILKREAWNKKWTKELCFEDALKYKTRNDWREKSESAYNAACTNKWLKDCCSHMIELKKPTGYWQIKKNCINEAKKYKTRNDWRKNSAGSYDAACDNGWFKECCKHMISGNKLYGEKKRKWTKESCLKDALKYRTRTEWYKKSKAAYGAARNNGWLEKCCKHMVSGNKLRWKK